MDTSEQPQTRDEDPEPAQEDIDYDEVIRALLARAVRHRAAVESLRSSCAYPDRFSDAP